MGLDSLISFIITPESPHVSLLGGIALAAILTFLAKLIFNMLKSKVPPGEIMAFTLELILIIGLWAFISEAAEQSKDTRWLFIVFIFGVIFSGMFYYFVRHLLRD